MSVANTLRFMILFRRYAHKIYEPRAIVCDITFFLPLPVAKTVLISDAATLFFGIRFHFYYRYLLNRSEKSEEDVLL